jgi:hypothetical protein
VAHEGEQRVEVGGSGAIDGYGHGLVRTVRALLSETVMSFILPPTSTEKGQSRAKQRGDFDHGSYPPARTLEGSLSSAGRGKMKA